MPDFDMIAPGEELPLDDMGTPEGDDLGGITEEQLGYADTLGWDERKLEAFLALIATTQAPPVPMV